MHRSSILGEQKHHDWLSFGFFVGWGLHYDQVFSSKELQAWQNDVIANMATLFGRGVLQRSSFWATSRPRQQWRSAPVGQEFPSQYKAIWDSGQHGQKFKNISLKLEFFGDQVSFEVAQETRPLENSPSKKCCHVGIHVILSSILEVLHWISLGHIVNPNQRRTQFIANHTTSFPQNYWLVHFFTVI